MGYDILKVPRPRRTPPLPAPPAVAAVWPLPRRADGPTDEGIRDAFARFPFWHYAYRFEGGLCLPTSHSDPGLDTDDPTRPLQRFGHFMPYLVHAHGGTLKGKRVLDIACNSGFWSIQCALLEAEVVDFDGRSSSSRMHRGIEQDVRARHRPRQLLRWETPFDILRLGADPGAYRRRAARLPHAAAGLVAERI